MLIPTQEKALWSLAETVGLRAPVLSINAKAQRATAIAKGLTFFFELQSVKLPGQAVQKFQINMSPGPNHLTEQKIAATWDGDRQCVEVTYQRWAQRVAKEFDAAR